MLSKSIEMAGLCHVLALRTRKDEADDAAEREKETTAPKNARVLLIVTSTRTLWWNYEPCEVSGSACEPDDDEREKLWCTGPAGDGLSRSQAVRLSGAARGVGLGGAGGSLWQCGRRLGRFRRLGLPSCVSGGDASSGPSEGSRTAGHAMMSSFQLPPILQSWSAFRLAAIAHFVDHPSHVVIETALSLFIIYVLFVKREYNPKKKCVAALKTRA